jgi:hypothetical protein
MIAKARESLLEIRAKLEGTPRSTCAVSRNRVTIHLVQDKQGKKPDNRRGSGLKTTNSEEGLLKSPYQAARVLVCQALSDLGR